MSHPRSIIEHVFGSPTAPIRSALEALARSFDRGSLSGDEAVAVVHDLGVIRKLADALAGQVALQVEGTGAHRRFCDRSAAVTVAKAFGIETGEAQRWTDPDGMVNGRLRLPAEVGGPIVGWFDEATRRVFRDRSRLQPEQHEPHAAYAADVFAELVRRNAWPSTEPDKSVGGVKDGGSLVGLELDFSDAVGGAVDLGFSHTVHVVIDHAALMRGECVEGERCEIPGVGPVSVAWARELLGDAFLTAVIKKGVDITTVAHLGRHIPAELRTALIVSGRECDIDGCGIRGYLEIDHTHEYAKGGPTSWHYLGWLCATHHRLETGGRTLGPRDPTTRKRTIHPPAASAGHRRRRPHAAA